jgi:predicted transcriptional regulator
MDMSHNPPICNNCKSVNLTISHSRSADPEGNGSFHWLFNFPDKLKNIIKIGLCVFFVVVLGLTILFQLKGFSFLFEINYKFLRYIPVFVVLLAVIGGFIFLRPKDKKRESIVENITSAQIESLLKADNKLTSSRLAKATNTSEAYAKKILDNMVVDGKLNVSSADSYELVYSKNLLS